MRRRFATPGVFDTRVIDTWADAGLRSPVDRWRPNPNNWWRGRAAIAPAPPVPNEWTIIEVTRHTAVQPRRWLR